MLKRSKKKSVKVSEECWKALKVFTAEHNWTMEGFTEFAIREKINRETVEAKQSGESK